MSTDYPDKNEFLPLKLQRGKHSQARWARTKEGTPSTIDTSDEAVSTLLRRIKATNDANEVRRLSDQLERVIFHKQYPNT